MTLENSRFGVLEAEYVSTSDMNSAVPLADEDLRVHFLQTKSDLFTLFGSVGEINLLEPPSYLRRLSVFAKKQAHVMCASPHNMELRSSVHLLMLQLPWPYNVHIPTSRVLWSICQCA